MLQMLNSNAQNKKFYYSASCHISYAEIGKGKTSLIFLHGFGSSMSNWEDIKGKFDTNKFRLFLIDLKGFGSSSKPKDNNYSIHEQSKIISDFINQKIKADYYIIGHSYGGGVTLLLLPLLNLSPSGLILIDCAAYNSNIPFFISCLKNSITNKLVYCIPHRIRARYILKRILHIENYSEKLVDRYAKSFNGKNKRYSFIKTAKQIIPANYDEIIASYKLIKIPTLIIWGEQDNVLPIEQGKLLNKQIQSSQLKTIASCGHVPQEEKPEKTYEMIIEFYEKTTQANK